MIPSCRGASFSALLQVPPSQSCEYTTKSGIRMIRYRGRVAYEGTSFNGWQSQQRGRSVQGDLQKVLSKCLNQKIKLVGAGRTDAGVHARGQAFHFDVLTPPPPPAQENGLLSKNHDMDNGREDEDWLFCHALQQEVNTCLGPDVRVYGIQKAPPPEWVEFDGGGGGDSGSSKQLLPWNVMYQATQKLYSYRFATRSPNFDPLQRLTRTMWHMAAHQQIDIDLLRQTLAHYEGTHDFRAFAGAIESNERKANGLPAAAVAVAAADAASGEEQTTIRKKNTVRQVHKVVLVEEHAEEGLYRIDVLLKGALYKMVRNMVGTAMEVAKGNLSQDEFLSLLHQKKNDNAASMSAGFGRRDNPCKPAPPQGLTLEHVFFSDDF